MGEFLAHVRKRVALTPEKALFFFLDNNTMPVLSRIMSDIYKDNKDQDGFLYVTYGTEVCFGNF
jgi:microtubule-associated protein 1 light chain